MKANAQMIADWLAAGIFVIIQSVEYVAGRRGQETHKKKNRKRRATRRRFISSEKRWPMNAAL
jgi:hypothetical protein